MRLRLRCEQISASNLGFVVPDADVAALGGGGRPRVSVRVGDATFGTSIARMGGRYLIGLTKANRAATGVEPGADYDVDVDLDTSERVVDIPPALAEVLGDDPALREAWDRWSFTRRREAAEAIAGAKRDDTRERRLLKLRSELLG